MCIYVIAFMYVSLSLYIYIYMYVYNPHLGLINAPPPYFVFLQTTFFTIHLLSTRPEIYNIMAKTLLIIFPPSWGDPFARIEYGYFYIIHVTLIQTIWVSLFFRIWVVWYFIVAFINFRGPRDFINRRGLYTCI